MQNFIKLISGRVVCVTRVDTSKPEYIRNYTSHHPTQENFECFLHEAACATAAAPVYFDPVVFEKNGERFRDGALHDNNPVFVAVAELDREPSFKHRDIGCLLSVGTGKPAVLSLADGFGFKVNAVKMLTDAENIATRFENSSDGARLIRDNAYNRFSVPQGLENLKLDECKHMNLMRSLTSKYLGSGQVGSQVERCAGRLLNPSNVTKAFSGESTNIATALLDRETPVGLRRHRPVGNLVRRTKFYDTLATFFDAPAEVLRVFVLWGMGGVG